MVRLRVLGQPEVRSGEKRIPFRSAKAIELLAYLATSEDRQASRSEVASALWPEAEPRRQRPNLRQTLQYIRHAEQAASVGLIRLNDDLIEVIPDVVMDVEGAGVFLSGFEGEWIEARRSAFERQQIQDFIQRGEELLYADPTKSLELAESAIAIDPFLESARLLKVSALRQLGEGAKAAQAAEQYAVFVKNELGVEPSAGLLRAGSGKARHGTDARQTSITARERVLLLIATAPGHILEGTMQEVSAELQDALSELRENPSVERQAKITLGRLALELGDFRKALRLMREVLSAGEEGLSSEPLCLYGRLVFQAGNMPEAAIYARKAITLAKKAKDAEPLVEALLLGTQVQWARDDLEGMLKLCDRALRLCEASKATRLKWRTLDSRASALFRLNRIEECAECYRLAMAEAKSLGRPDMSAYSRSKLGRLMEVEGRFEEAQVEHLAALEVLETSQSRSWLAQTVTYLGDLETRLGRPAEGHRYHAWGIGLRRMTGELMGLGTSLRGLGKALIAQGRYEEAADALRESIKSYLQLGDRPSAGSARVPLAQALVGLRQGQQAARMLDLADEALSSLSDAQIMIYFNDETLLAANRAAMRTGI